MRIRQKTKIPAMSVIQRAGDILAKRLRDYYERQDSCVKCAGTGWINPESEDSLLDIPYRCDHRTGAKKT